MKGWDFYTPVHVIFGRGMLEELGTYASGLGKKGAVVTDRGMVACGVAGRITEILDKAGIDYRLWSDIVPNPRDVDIERAAAWAKEEGIDYLIAVGGGSSMDTAKAMGALMTNGGRCSDWEDGNLEHKIAPLICIPTTCGTGSEVTHEAIVNNTTTLEKDCIWGPENSAEAAILDSTLLDHLPAKLLSSTGMDALTHAVEAYVCRAHNPLTDALAEKAIRLISGSIVDACGKHEPEDLDAMMAASTLAGMAFGNADVASVHSISEALGGFYDIPHGVANAMMLGPVSRRSIEGAPERYADIAEFMGVDTRGLTTRCAAVSACDAMQHLADQLQIPHFCDFDIVDPKDFPRLAKTAAAADETQDNPVIFDEAAYVRILTEVYEGRP